MRPTRPATITAQNVIIATHGAGSSGVESDDGGVINMTGGTITTTSANAQGILTTASTSAAAAYVGHVNITDVDITAAGDGIRSFGGTSIVTLTGSTLTAGSGLALNVQQNPGGGTPFGAVTTVNADASSITGAMVTDSISTSTVSLTNGTQWTMTGNSNLTNLSNTNSTISITAPTADPALLASYKTLTVNNYVGSAGVIGMNTYLGADGSPSDLLIINGGAATGSTGLVITNSGGGGALTTADGILVVSAISGATTEAGAFELNGRAASGAYEYELFRGDASGGGESWYLRSFLIPEPGPEPEPLPNYRDEVPVDMVAPALAARYGLAVLDAVRLDRLNYPDEGAFGMRPGPAGPEDGPGAPQTIWCKDPARNFRCAPTPAQNATYADASRDAMMRNLAWGHVFGESGDVDYGVSGLSTASLNAFEENGASYDYRLGGVVAGLDVYRNQTEDGARNVAGLFVGAGRVEGDVQAVYGGDAGSSSMNAYSVGGYWLRKGSSGLKTETQLIGTFYDQVRGESVKGETLETDGWGVSASAQAGYEFAVGSGWTVEPQLQGIYQSVSINDGADRFGRVQFDDANTFYGRAGAKVTKDFGGGFVSWGEASVWRHFGSDADVTFSSLKGDNPVILSSDLGGTWVDLGAGAAFQMTETTSLVGNFNYATDLDGESQTYGGKLGLKVEW